MEEWNDKSFEGYDFIAHVKVLGVDEVNGPFERNIFRWESALIRIEILELYRGEKVEMIINNDYSSSCGISILKNEEWIVFAIRNRAGDLFIHACTSSTEYRDKDGQKLLRWGYPGRVKHWVDTTCQIALPGIAYSGAETYHSYYANDQLEEETEYLDGEKHGKSIHYYPDGTLMDERHFHKGKPTDLRRYYKGDGSLDFELEFNFRGELVRETNYSKGYDDLRHEIVYTPETKLEKDFAFRADGTLARLAIRQDWDMLSDRYYDRKEKLIHHLVYDNWEKTVLLDSLER